MVSSTTYQHVTQGVGEVGIFVILLALSLCLPVFLFQVKNTAIVLLIELLLLFFSFSLSRPSLRTHLQGVKVVMKTLSAGFHQPIQGILSLPLVSIASEVNMSPASPAELNTHIETICLSPSYFNVSLSPFA